MQTIIERFQDPMVLTGLIIMAMFFVGMIIGGITGVIWNRIKK